MAGSDAMLAGITVWVTRPAHQAGDLCRMIEQRKGVPLPLPTLVIRPFTEARAEENRVLLAHADITVFISKNAVIHALDLFPDIADTVRGKTVLAVGQATARCLTASGFDMVGHAVHRRHRGAVAVTAIERSRHQGETDCYHTGTGRA